MVGGIGSWPTFRINKHKRKVRYYCWFSLSASRISQPLTLLPQILMLSLLMFSPLRHTRNSISIMESLNEQKCLVSDTTPLTIKSPPSPNILTSNSRYYQGKTLPILYIFWISCSFQNKPQLILISKLKTSVLSQTNVVTPKHGMSKSQSQTSDSSAPCNPFQSSPHNSNFWPHHLKMPTNLSLSLSDRANCNFKSKLLSNNSSTVFWSWLSTSPWQECPLIFMGPSSFFLYRCWL